ncbi:MAG: ABC transporter ATP-binding protein [Victivallales bacterium]
MKTLLQIQDLGVTKGSFSISGINLSLNENDYLVLLGPTGSGKTILLRTIAGFNTPVSGRIILDGNDITEMPAHKRGIVYLSQHNDLFPHLNVYDNIAFGLRFTGMTEWDLKQRVEKYVDIFGLGNLLERDIRTLSGGEGKKVMMARSLAIHPKILLLDEPLGMLDHNARFSLLEKFMEVHRKLNLTIIQVSHHREEARLVNQEAAVLNQGRIEQTGSVDDVFIRPANSFVKEFLGR